MPSIVTAQLSVIGCLTSEMKCTIPIFCNALAYAAKAHKEHLRKATQVPYITHLLGVTAIVLDAEGSEAEAIAAVLHDVVQDQPLPEGGGRGRLADVRSKFGSHVASIVEALSDWVSTDIAEKREQTVYIDRKRAYHAHLRSETDRSVLLVSAADKLHNARAIESDFDKIGARLWEPFNGTPEQIFQNYDQLIAIYRAAAEDSRRAPIVDLLAKTMERLRNAFDSAALVAPSRAGVAD